MRAYCTARQTAVSSTRPSLLVDNRSGAELGSKPKDRANVGFFFQLEPETRQLLTKGALSVDFEKGEQLMSSGDKANVLFVLLSGNVKAYRRGPERQLCLSILGPGDIFGELSAIDGLDSTADIVATKPGQALAVEQNQLLRVMKSDPLFLEEFLRYLSNKMRATIDDICSFALDSVYVRLRRILYRLAPAPNGTMQIPDITHLQLSEMVGASREMVSIIMKELRTGGYIASDGKSILICRELPKNR